MNGIQIFKSNEFGAIRTLSNPQGQPLFCAKDVALALGFQDTHSAIHRYVAEKELSILGALDTLGRKNYITFMTKRGMQALIRGAKGKQARQFKRWISGMIVILNVSEGSEKR